MRNLKLGLALGAGGTKGAAHVGVMQVLDEAGIAPDGHRRHEHRLALRRLLRGRPAGAGDGRRHPQLSPRTTSSPSSGTA